MAPVKDNSTAPADEAPAADEAPSLGDLVELHDGCYALVVAANPVSVVRLGHPQAYELEARRVLS